MLRRILLIVGLQGFSLLAGAVEPIYIGPIQITDPRRKGFDNISLEVSFGIDLTTKVIIGEHGKIGNGVGTNEIWIDIVPHESPLYDKIDDFMRTNLGENTLDWTGKKYESFIQREDNLLHIDIRLLAFPNNIEGANKGSKIIIYRYCAGERPSDNDFNTSLMSLIMIGDTKF